MTWNHHLLFPTRVLTAQSHDATLLAGLSAMFAEDPRFRHEHFADIADTENLLDRAGRYPVMDRLKDFMWSGLLAWLDAEHVTGSFVVSSFYFPNYSRKGGFVPAHNHLSHVSGVFYVSVPERAGEESSDLVQGDEAAYWHLDHGVLILHDPRFNASLADVGSKNWAKVFPRPGMAVLFPSSLWHSVTPHLGDEDRIAVSVNFTLESSFTSSLPRERLELPARRKP